MQTGLELYFAKNQSYPVQTSWASLQTAITGASIGVNNIPNDPRGGAQTYYYFTDSTGSTYVIGAILEDTGNAAFNGMYSGTPPTSGMSLPAGASACGGTPTAGGKLYCVSL